jgi:hypothetical protein
MTYESRALLRFRGVLTRSDRDAHLVRAIAPRTEVVVASSWPLTYDWALDPRRPRPRPRPDRHVVMFLGAMWRSVNSEACESFLEQAWPLVRARVPDAEFRVVGAGPPPSILSRHGSDGVVVTGYVEDLMVHYHECSVLVVPLLAAGGIITKVADAMHIGLPVVASSVANQGIGAAPDSEILIADEPRRFADHVVRLLTDDALYARVSLNAEQCMRRHFDWDGTLRRVEALWEHVAAGSAPQAPQGAAGR